MGILMAKQKYIAEYKDLRFKTEREYRKWLKDKTAFYIEFEDQGQDLTGLWIDEGGEILQTKLPSLGRVFNGKMVLISDLRVGAKAGNFDPATKEFNKFRYIVTKVDKRK
jgi:hypothetical protein